MRRDPRARLAPDGNETGHTLRVWNETRDICLVDNGRVARSLWARTRGLLGTSVLPPGEGLLLEHCSSIHSFWMRYPFDALFLDAHGSVVHLIAPMKPNRVSRHVFAARWVLELPAGVIAATSIQLGDQLRWTGLSSQA